MAKKKQENSNASQVNASNGSTSVGNINVGGNVGGDINIGNTIIHYHTADGEKREMRTGWFYGHRYGDLESFTGRVDELKLLDDWLANKTESLLIFNAFGGFGKSALTWHWLNNHVDKTLWSTAIWWSFYEKESGFDSFLSEALTHLGIETKDRSSRQQVNDLLDVMQQTGLLIVLDGFERLLRQYGRMDAALQEDDEDAEIDPSQRDCTYQSAETFLRGLSDKKIISKVLMTSRLLPKVLEGKDGKLQPRCHEVSLKGLSPDDAVKYFQKEEIKGTRAEIIEVCSKYGYHPLSLSLLVGLINEDHEKHGDIAAVKNLEIFEDVRARRHHVLERAYKSLAPERRDLLSKISCFRGSMEYAVLKKVFPSLDLDKALLDLRKRGLLQYAGETQRYDMHPIVRHYAYDRFTDTERKKAHKALAFHFIDVMVDVMPMTNTKVKTLEDLAPVIELYHHMVGAGNLDEALKLYYDRLQNAVYFQFGAYQLEIELLHALFPYGEDKPPRLKKDDAQAFTLNGLALAYALSGQPRRAVSLFELVNIMLEKAGDKENLAIGLGNKAIQQLAIGALGAAVRNLRQSIDLYCEIQSEFNEAVGHQELGRVLSYQGAWQEAEQEFSKSLEITEKKTAIQNQGITWSYRAQRFLLIIRSNPKSKIENLKSSIKCVQLALELAEGGDPNIGNAIVPRDLVRSHWLLGAAYRINNDLTLAEENLSKALNLCRQINNVESEADILLDVARLRYAQGDFKDAQEKAFEALMITERCEYVLQGADVNLFLAQYTLEQEKDKAKAKVYAEEAKKLATCDGPPYYYKVAYEEAEAMLEKLK